MSHREKPAGLADRIETILQMMRWSKSDLARAIGVTPSAVGNWIRRDQGMEPQYAFLLQDKYRWNARWILEGVGPARIEGMSKEDEQTLQRIRELPPDRLRALAVILGLDR